MLGFGKSKDEQDWEAEFDRRMNDPSVPKDMMRNSFNLFRPTEPRVADDEGTMRRRNGEGCCGCGKWKSETFRDKPVFESHHHDGDHHHDDEDSDGGLIWGIF